MWPFKGRAVHNLTFSNKATRLAQYCGNEKTTKRLCHDNIYIVHNLYANKSQFPSTYCKYGIRSEHIRIIMMWIPQEGGRNRGSLRKEMKWGTEMFASCIQMCPNNKNKTNSVSRRGKHALFCQLVIGPGRAHLSCELAALLGFHATPHRGYFHTATSYGIPSALALNNLLNTTQHNNLFYDVD